PATWSTTSRAARSASSTFWAIRRRPTRWDASRARSSRSASFRRATSTTTSRSSKPWRRAVGAPLIVVSNRGPVTYELTPSGERIPRRGAGGLVTAISGALRDREGLWIASAISEGDRAVAADDATVGVEIAGGNLSVRLV